MPKHAMTGVEGFVRRAEHFLVDPRAILVRDGWNPRTNFAIADLKADIAVNGVKVPLEVRKSVDDTIELNDGERRLRAVMELIEEGFDIKAVPVMLARRGASDAELLTSAIVRNDSKPFEPIEEATAYQRLVNWGYSTADIAQRVGKSETHIKRQLRLIDAGPQLQQAVAAGEVSAKEARKMIDDSAGDLGRQEQALASRKMNGKPKNFALRITRGKVKQRGPVRSEYLEKLIESRAFRDGLIQDGIAPESIQIRAELFQRW